MGPFARKSIALTGASSGIGRELARRRAAQVAEEEQCRARGRIVAVSSLAGKTGVPTRTAYAASEHAMAGFFDSLRIELAPRGVAVTVIYPGFVATGVRRHAFGPDGRPLGESPVREGEVMTAEECAGRIVRAAARREREVVMTARGKVGQWLRLVAPRLTDEIARRALGLHRQSLQKLPGRLRGS